MSATITLDQINAINALDKLGMLDPTMAARILGESAPTPAPEPATIAPVRTVQRTVKPASVRKSDDKLAWTLKDPSNAQLDRINRAEEAILESGRKRGIKLIAIGAQRDMHVGTAGAASRYYKSLAAFTNAHGIKF